MSHPIETPRNQGFDGGSWLWRDAFEALEDAAQALEFQMELLVSVAEDAEWDKEDWDAGLAHKTLIVRLELAQQHLLGLIHITQVNLPAPAEALFRAVWESLLKALYFLHRPEAENATLLLQYFEATLEANAATGTPRARMADQRLQVGPLLKALKKIDPDVAETFETAKTLFYDVSCGFLHADLGGAMGANVRQTRHVLPGQKLAAYGSTFLWASLLVSATLDGLAKRFPVDERALQEMRFAGGTILDVLPDEEE